ncbi:HNH endonuclease [Streptomyces sp. NPDC007088]|uniref:HNH endonuclease n=1 Tax=Streptomyces sp. NPDC007088 TaxID=3364773 RepID=UPI003681EE99
MRVGNEMLFYAEYKFIARARITDRMRNPGLAETVWGRDPETGAVWEHVVVLEDIEEIEIDARPILGRLSLTPPLRSLTLVSAADSRRISGLVRPRGVLRVGEAERRRHPATRASTQPLDHRGLIRGLMELLPQSTSAEARRAVTVMILLAGLTVREEQRLRPWPELLRQVAGLRGDDDVTVVASSAEEASALAPSAFPLSGRARAVWELAVGADGVSRVGFTVRARRLLEQPLVRAEVVGQLRRFLPVGLEDELLAALGLAGYAHAGGVAVTSEATPDTGPVERTAVRSSRAARDTETARSVKALHRNGCQICGIRLEVKNGQHFSQAAHIQGLGRPHYGPDRLDNLLCLCPNCHLQFDDLALYVDTDWSIRWSKNHEAYDGGKTLVRVPGHEIDPGFLTYHRALCGRYE